MPPIDLSSCTAVSAAAAKRGVRAAGAGPREEAGVGAQGVGGDEGPGVAVVLTMGDESFDAGDKVAAGVALDILYLEGHGATIIMESRWSCAMIGQYDTVLLER